MRRSRTVALALGLALVLLLGTHAALVVTAPSMRPLAHETLLPDAAHTPVDDHLWVARLVAPRLLHETHAELGRQDVPTAMDFDGDRDATNNWENFPRFELVPTVYYTVVETGTHYVVSYHFYHPRDWAIVALGIQDTHEGDGENVQVVVDKATMEPLVLTTQAHYRMWSYATVGGPVTSGEETLRGEFEVDRGQPIVYVESGGHGIYGSFDPRAANRLARIGQPVISYQAAQEGGSPSEPAPPWNDTATYRLVSLPAFLGNSTDHATLFAGYVGDTPRYHKGDRYSGPLGASRGISPFALGYGWSRDEIGSLFWDPAERYPRALAIEGNWSREYVAHPFLP